MDDYITKPIEYIKLVNTIEKWASQLPKKMEIVTIKSTPTEKKVPQSVAAVKENVTSSIQWSVLDKLSEFQKPGEADLVQELVDLYFETSPATLTKIREAARSNNLEELRAEAHSLKSSSGNLGIHRVSTICKMLEKIASGDAVTSEADNLVTLLEEEFKNAKAELQTGLKARQRQVS